MEVDLQLWMNRRGLFSWKFMCEKYIGYFYRISPQDIRLKCSTGLGLIFKLPWPGRAKTNKTFLTTCCPTQMCRKKRNKFDWFLLCCTPDFGPRWSINWLYRVTIQLVQNLLTSKTKLRFGLACPGLAMPKRNFCFDVNWRFCTSWMVTLYINQKLPNLFLISTA